MLEAEVLSLIKERCGEVETPKKEKPSLKDLEKQMRRLENKRAFDFEKYKLGKMTKLKFIESKEQIDKEIEKLL